MNIAVHIDRLVLDGLPLRGDQGPAFQAAITAELTRLLGERGLSGLSGGAVPELRVPPLQLARFPSPAQLGSQVAHSLHAGLAPATTGSAVNVPRR